MARSMSQPLRRSQADRSEAMRKRLIEATLDCLITDGYAKLTIGGIVERAGVSRGAPLHHFTSKAALVEASAEHVLQEVSTKVMEAHEAAQSSDDPMGVFLTLLWREIFGTDLGAMVTEFSHASRHDADLAPIVEKLLLKIYQTSARVSERYVRARSDKVPAARITVLTQWMMRGMAMDRHLGAPDGFFERLLEHWRTLLDDAVAESEDAPDQASL